MGLAYIPYVAVMNSENGPVVNLYNQGEFAFATPRNREGTISIETDYPLSGEIDMNLSLEKAESFTLRVRIPQWSEKTVITVNNQNIEATPGTYVDINRKWETDDNISILLDMRCKVVQAPRGSNRAGDNFEAVVYGPIVLARDESMDKNYAEAVKLMTEQGYIDAKRVHPVTGNYKLQFEIPVNEDQVISMVDYASVDNWSNGLHICTWLPTKK